MMNEHNAVRQEYAAAVGRFKARQAVVNDLKSWPEWQVEQKGRDLYNERFDQALNRMWQEHNDAQELRQQLFDVLRAQAHTERKER